MKRFGVTRPDFVSGQTKLFIGRRWVDPRAGCSTDVNNPATGEWLCAIVARGAADCDLAAEAALTAFEGEWSRWNAHADASGRRSGSEASRPTWSLPMSTTT